MKNLLNPILCVLILFLISCGSSVENENYKIQLKENRERSGDLNNLFVKRLLSLLEDNLQGLKSQGRYSGNLREFESLYFKTKDEADELKKHMLLEVIEKEIPITEAELLISVRKAQDSLYLNKGFSLEVIELKANYRKELNKLSEKRREILLKNKDEILREHTGKR
ncbi:MAG: hypothetical protein AAFX87_26010 [Bacteroidota bacterium]